MSKTLYESGQELREALITLRAALISALAFPIALGLWLFSRLARAIPERWY